MGPMRSEAAGDEAQRTRGGGGVPSWLHLLQPLRSFRRLATLCVQTWVDEAEPRYGPYERAVSIYCGRSSHVT